MLVKFHLDSIQEYIVNFAVEQFEIEWLEKHGTSKDVNQGAEDSGKHEKPEPKEHRQVKIKYPLFIVRISFNHLEKKRRESVQKSWP